MISVSTIDDATMQAVQWEELEMYPPIYCENRELGIKGQ